MTPNSRMLAQLLTVSVLLLVETNADVLVQPGYNQPGRNQEHQSRQDSSQFSPQQHYQQHQQWQQQSFYPYQSQQAAANPADPTVSTSLISPFLLPPMAPFGGIIPGANAFSLGPMGLHSLRLGGYGLPPLLMSPHSQNLPAHPQFPRSTDRQLQDGVSGHEQWNAAKSPSTCKSDVVASNSSVKYINQNEHPPAAPTSQLNNNLNEKLVGSPEHATGWTGRGKSDHEIVGSSLLDPLGLIEKTENAVENFGAHLPPILDPTGVLRGMNSPLGFLGPSTFLGESANSQILQNQNAPQNIPLGSPGNPNNEGKQSDLLGSRANAMDYQTSTQHRESYQPTAYQSGVRQPSSSSPLGSPAKVQGNVSAGKQQYPADSSARPYQQATLGNPMSNYQDRSACRNAAVAQSWNPAQDRTNVYRGNQVKSPSFANYQSNPVGRTAAAAGRSPYVGATSPYYGKPSHGYNNNNNANVRAPSPSRMGQNQQFVGAEQRPAANYPAGSSYGSNDASMTASSRQNIPAEYGSTSQGRTIPLLQDFEYSRPSYGYGHGSLPGGWNRYDPPFLPPASSQSWMSRPFSLYNDNMFDDFSDFSYRSYRPTY